MRKQLSKNHDSKGSPQARTKFEQNHHNINLPKSQKMYKKFILDIFYILIFSRVLLNFLGQNFGFFLGEVFFFSGGILQFFSRAQFFLLGQISSFFLGQFLNFSGKNLKIFSGGIFFFSGKKKSTGRPGKEHA